MRIEPLESNQASWLVRPLYFYLKRRFGRVVTPSKVWAHRPGPMIGFSIAMTAIESGGVADPIVKRLVSLRAAQLVGCVF